MRAVRGDKNQLRLSLAHTLHGMLVTQNGLSGLHDQLQTAVHVILLLLLRSREKKGKINIGLETDWLERIVRIVLPVGCTAHQHTHSIGTEMSHKTIHSTNNVEMEINPLL